MTYTYIVCGKCGHIETVVREHEDYVECCENCRTRTHTLWFCSKLYAAEECSERVLAGGGWGEINASAA